MSQMKATFEWVDARWPAWAGQEFDGAKLALRLCQTYANNRELVRRTCIPLTSSLATYVRLQPDPVTVSGAGRLVLVTA